MTDLRSQQRAETLRHTPTPWTLAVEVNDAWSSGPVQTVTIDAGEKLIATYKTHFVEYPESDEENAANAALIVDAVNSHEALKARIQELETALATEKEESASYHRFWIEERAKVAALSKGAA